jgi:hypothetical protein
MISAILALLPAHAHPLALAHDPDGLLDDPELGAKLSERGFRTVQASDNFRLWLAVDDLRPWSADSPVLVITPQPLNELPFEIWAQGHRVELGLERFFPQLSLPVVRQLTPAQRRALFVAPTPAGRLSRTATARYLLQHVFGADLPGLHQPHALLDWLRRLHGGLGPLRADLSGLVSRELGGVAVYADWPLDAMLTDEAAFREHLARMWVYAPSRVSPPGGHLSDTLGHLARETRLTQLLAQLAQAIGGAARWEDWCGLAWLWAEATGLQLDDAALAAAHAGDLAQARVLLDERWLTWLLANYGPLAGQALPQPHHLYHVLPWLASQRRGRRVALIVLDGLALCDWLLIKGAWRVRHPEWHLDERLALAQLPTITSVSRQALVSGRPPRAFANSLSRTSAEPQLWRAFWQSEGLAPGVIAYDHLALDRELADARPWDHRTAALCLVDASIDELCHAATQGTADARGSLRRWLAGASRAIEAIISDLLASGFVVCLGSDHGHVEAVGAGRPADGILAETRGQRARLYADRAQAQHIAASFADTVLWPDDGLLPVGVHAVMHTGRGAFAPAGERLVSHGGATIEEACVPIILIEAQS